MVFLSIIIPMYNSELTIKKCLDSIGDNNKVEIILIDDGSTDSTKLICETNYRNKNLIKYIYQNNSGPGVARNTGISAATGKYIMFLDSDDYLDTQVLNTILDNYLIQGEYDIIYYDFDQVNEAGQVIRHFDLSAFNRVDKYDLMTYTLSWTLPWGQFKIINRNIIDKFNIRFDEDNRNSEELIFTLNCINSASKLLFCNLTLYKYLKREGSMSVAVTWEHLFKTSVLIMGILKSNFGDTHKQGIYNFELVIKIQILKLLAEQCKGFSGYIKYKKLLYSDVHYLLEMADINYLQKRYQFIYRCLKVKMDIILYISFKGLKLG
ncbi:glycosyltransferase family 2 protein [Ruminiclostridium cellobioparum]|uniref:Glycosyltransferases involved in cell wall biogenesis n=1 Tax=Ruminiclostridium cellobioparum subsp. termitidis CT1112 TaxID=1195236 RepID=S0FJC8_RUMCE|nr:glycosyltransferase family 2 protein [Ruminiclostridium cellobioparum]EMS70351.1 Glycosyltransferases involved in cell wall biogenesis [Ruminiclostridium cellobioparum subsp. termitidis CT1112]